ncbi:MAG: protein phosphatase 2C domain-containing protein [Acidobacteriota bacterium]|nr:protein phosphatase 2C domain-containing protein [Acidobacteriota bacterium]
MIVELHAQTDVGRVRQGNEDNFLALDLSTARGWIGSDNVSPPPAELLRFEPGPHGLVLVVSDGMGGALAGDVASRMAIESVREKMLNGVASSSNAGTANGPALVDRLFNATGYANYEIHRKSLEDARCSGMGATLTAAAITGQTLDFVQVGDSRAYVVRGNQIKLATKDQSLVQQLVDVGQITEQDAETHMFRNVILQALGAQRDLTPVITRVHLRRGDTVLLCSDGLSGKMRAEEMREIITQAETDLTIACQQLIELANRRGGEDNITVLLARFDGDPLAAPTSDDIAIEQLEPEDDDDNTLSGHENDTTLLP